MTTARLNPGIPLLLNGVSKRYGSKTILNELDLHVPTGQFVAVVGRSGGGKSTLLRLLAGQAQRRPAAGGLDAAGTNSGRYPDDVPGFPPAAVENGDRQRRTGAERPVA